MEPYLHNYRYFQFLCAMLYLKRNIGSTLIALWKIEESFDELLAMLDDKSMLTNILSVKSARIRLEKIAIRVLLKTILGEEQNIVYNEAGRPFLHGKDLHVSISHTNGFVAIALNKANEVGLDIEYISDKILRVKERIVSDAEYIDLSQELTHLLLHWCAKESMFKVMDSEGVDYIDHMYINNFTPSMEGWFKAGESKTAQKRAFDVYYIVDPDFVLTCLTK